MSSVGGERKKVRNTAAPAYDPYLQKLEQQRSDLATDIMAGNLPSSMSGFISKILTPEVTNTMTAAGLGRSGAIGEAISNAVLGQGTSMLTSLLTGVPSAQGGQTPGSQITRTDTGYKDIMGGVGALAGGIAACWLARACFGGEVAQTSIFRGWIFRHPQLLKLYCKVAPHMNSVAWIFRPLLSWVVRRELRAVTIRG